MSSERSVYGTSMLLALMLLSACGSGAENSSTGESKSCTKDSECNDGLFCNGEEICDPEDSSSDAAGCRVPFLPCLTGQRCEERKSTCVTECAATRDADADGADAIECGGSDCDDSSASRFPGNEEVCDVANIDEDCDPKTFGFRDTDEDGFADAACCNVAIDGEMSCGPDCDDQSPTVHPTEAESCNGVDDDCDGEIDNLIGDVATLWADKDGDGFGDKNSPVLACTEVENLVSNQLDCDDGDAEVNPGEEDDSCNGVDNDCDGEIDEDATGVLFEDADGDGFGDPNAPAIGCTPGLNLVDNREDCNDKSAVAHPMMAEVNCDKIDNDCNGQVDEGGEAPLWYLDADGDGHGALGSPAVSDCTEIKPGFSRTNEDCKDNDPTIHPLASEICDGKDNDCSSGGGARLSEDRDGDGFTAVGYTGCSGGMKTDCDDYDANRNPDETEVCDGVDNDCSGPAGHLEDEDDDGFAGSSAQCTGGRPKTDCIDDNKLVNPNAVDICNGLDDDCSGTVDNLCPTGWENLGAATTAANVMGHSSDAPNFTQDCGTGELLVGLRMGWYETKDGGDGRIDSLQIRCAAISMTETQGATAWSYSLSTGSPRNVEIFNEEDVDTTYGCAGGQVVRALSGKGETGGDEDINQLTMSCFSVEAVRGESTAQFALAQRVASADKGADESEPLLNSPQSCPSGYAAAGLTVHRGGYHISRIGLRCVPLESKLRQGP